MSSKVITREDGTPYLIRTTIFKCRWFQINIHKILISDYDCLHDHPWSFISIILRGGYYERTFWRDAKMGEFERKWFEENSKFGQVRDAVRKKWYRPGSILWRPAEWKHSLEIPKGKTATTLVITFKRRRKWGFWTKKGWVFWKEYKPTSTCE
jgi:hypothetical protein